MVLITLLAALCTLVVSEPTSTEIHPLSDEFIDLINSEQTSWRAGRNFAEDTPLEYLKILSGALISNSTDELEVVKHPAELLANLPEEFDARKKWPNCPSLNHIRDQGSCASCWAVAAAAAMSDRYCIFSNGTTQLYFSYQDLLSCCKYCRTDCIRGGHLDEAWSYWVDHGIVSGADYKSKQGCLPYEIPPCNHKINNNSNLPNCRPMLDVPVCKSKCIDEYKKTYNSDKHYGKNMYSIAADEDQIKAELYHHGPVSTFFRVYSNFWSYKSGVYFYKAKYLEGYQNHAVKILGWGIEENKKYWLVANSWNSEWGDKGYFKILRGVNHLKIEENVIAGIPKIAEN